MADGAVNTEWRDEYRRLRKAGVPKEQAIAQVRRTKAPPAEPPNAAPAVNITPGQSAAAGVASGATLGFLDELAGIVGSGGHVAGAPGTTGAVVERLPGDAAENYRASRDKVRSELDERREANPAAFTAGQVAAGVATAPLAPAASTIKGAAVLGAAGGAAVGLGESEADITRGEVGEAASDTLKGALIGGASGGAAQGLVRGAQGVAGRASRGGIAASAAREAAEGADLPSNIGRGETIRTATEKAKALQEEWSSMLGERFRLRPGQVTGDRALALAEAKAAQFPKTMQRAQADEAKRLEHGAKIIDMYVDGIAAKPSRLGRSDVGEQLAGAVQRHIDTLRETRSRVASELFGEVDRIAGGQKIVKMEKTASTIHRLIEEMRSPLASGPSRSAMSELENLSEAMSKASDIGSPVDAMFSAREVQNALRDWGTKAASTGDVFKDMDRATGQRISKEIFRALQADLNSAAGSVAVEQLGAAGQALARARDVYRSMSEAIDEAGTDTVRRILKADGTDKIGTLTTRLLNATPEETTGVFRVLNRADPDTAQQLRAQLLDDVLTKAGKPSRAAPIASEMGVAKLSPRQALRALEKAEPVLQAAFTGDTKAKVALSRTYQLLQRLDFGPNIRGSQTAPMLAQAIEEAGDTAAVAAAGPQGAVAMRAVRSLLGRLGGDRRVAEALTSQQGIDDFNRVLDAALSSQRGRRLSNEAARSLSVAIARLGINESQEEKTTTPSIDIKR